MNEQPNYNFAWLFQGCQSHGAKTNRGPGRKTSSTLSLSPVGAMYHIMSRGDQRDDIFLDDVVDGSNSGYLKTACDYVYLNPARAKLLKRANPRGHFAGAA